MSWKRYWVFLLLLGSSMVLIMLIDGMQGFGLGHIGQNVAFTFRMMDPFERMILLALLILLMRKPIGHAIEAAFGGKKGSSEAGTQASSQPPDQQ